jgi:predicted PurR-regulated permease PerM
MLPEHQETHIEAPSQQTKVAAPSSDLHFVKRVIIVLGVIAIAYFLWLTADVLMLVFAAILLAILLRSLAQAVSRWTRLAPSMSLLVAAVCVFGFIAGFIYVFGAKLSGQLMQLADSLPEAIDAAGRRFGIEYAAQRLQDAIKAEAGAGLLSSVTRWSYSIVGALANVLLVLVAAIYFAIDPCVYRRGLAMLFPPDQHQRVLSALDAAGNVLRHWLAGQFVTMLLVAAVSMLAYWSIGLPSPIALGLVAGLFNFVPYLGPVLSAIPPLLFALSMDTQTLLWTLGAVVAIQQFEGNVVTPLIQRRAVSLPPAVGVFAIVVFGVAFGIVGVFLAVPLAASLLVLVRKLWVRETLHGDAPAVGAKSSGA